MAKVLFNVTNVEIQDIKSKMANIAYVGVGVANVPKPKAMVAQKYPASTQELRKLEPELKPSLSLTSMELIVFFFLVINLMLLSTIYLIPCPHQILCDDYSEGLLSTVFSGLSASVIELWFSPSPVVSIDMS